MTSCCWLTAYWRFVSQSVDGVSRTEAELAAQRNGLDLAYETASVEGARIESRLAAYFADLAVGQAWHGAMDCLTVRYFTLILPAGSDAIARLYAANQPGDGGIHTGLSPADMTDRKTVVVKYQEWLRLAQEGVATQPLRRPV